MNDKTFTLRFNTALAAVAVVSLLIMSSIASAGDNPFKSIDPDNSFLLASGDNDKEGKCGEGKCGGDKGKESKCGDDKGKESKCGDDKGKESKCGDDKGKESKCGDDKGKESKCGGNSS